MKKYKIVSNDESQDVVIDLDGKIVKLSHKEAENLIDDVENEILNYRPLREKLEKAFKEDKAKIKLIKVDKIKEEIKELKRKLDFPILYNYDHTTGEIDTLQNLLGGKYD